MESVLNVECSAFKKATATERPKTVNLLHCLQDPGLLSGLFNVDCLKLQKQVRTSESVEVKVKAKGKMPALTPSGVFSERNSKGLLHHNGLVQVDIDSKDNTHLLNFDELREELSNIEEVAYCGRSVSGGSWWLLIPVAHPERHREHCLELERLFSGLIIAIDPKCFTPVQPRFYSYDPGAYFNHHAKPFRGLYSPPRHERHKPASRGTNDREGTPWSRYNENEDFMEVLEKNGWTVWRESAESVEFTRPGKPSGRSARFDRTHSRFHVYSSESAPFEHHTENPAGYSPFAVYSILEHGGDYKAAAKALQAGADFTHIKNEP